MFTFVDCFKNTAGVANSSIIPDYQMNASSQNSYDFQAAMVVLKKPEVLKPGVQHQLEGMTSGFKLISVNYSERVVLLPRDTDMT